MDSAAPNVRVRKETGATATFLLADGLVSRRYFSAGRTGKNFLPPAPDSNER
jgi:hypothetical protein